MNKYVLGASSDIGIEREKQEDFIQFKELDENNILAVIADGTGSVKEHLQPAVMSTMSIIEEISDIYEQDMSLLMENPLFFLRRAVLNANNMIGALKLGNEEIYSGYAASITVALLTEDDKLHVAHAGNTRLYLMRKTVLTQITKDHTKAQELFDDGTIDINTYHVHPDRLKVTSGVGICMNPEIMAVTCPLKPNDIVVMTTDGIHFAINSEALTKIILESNECVASARNLIEAAKNIVKYPDNMSAVIIHQLIKREG